MAGSRWHSYMWHADGWVRSFGREHDEETGIATPIDDIPPLLDGLEAGGVQQSSKADMVRYYSRWINRSFLNDVDKIIVDIRHIMYAVNSSFTEEVRYSIRSNQ